MLILNETYNKTFLISNDNQDGNLLTINNVKLYGSVSNYNQSNPALVAEQTSISDLDTYVSINSILKSGSAGGTLTLFNGSGLNASQNIGTNYGVLVAANGDDGANGGNASGANKSGDAGTAGYSGGSIQAFSQDGDSSQAGASLSNQGILKVGDGGNGGAGGSTYYVTGVDGINGDGSYVSYDVSGGAQGSGGKIGSIIGFEAQAKSIGLYGIHGQTGFKGRTPLYGIQLNGTRSLSSENESWNAISYTNNSNASLPMKDLPGYGLQDNYFTDSFKSAITTAFDRTVTASHISDSAKTTTAPPEITTSV